LELNAVLWLATASLFVIVNQQARILRKLSN
jgi:hypothetical protein